jgi:hypothetical protein
VVKKHEEACVVGKGKGKGDVNAFRVHHCIEFYLKDVGAKCNHLHSLRWLRLEHVSFLLLVKFLPSQFISISLYVFVGLPQDQDLAFCLGLCFSFFEEKTGWMPILIFFFLA